MKLVCFLSFVIVCQLAAGQGTEYRSSYAKAIEAYKGKDYKTFYALIKQANELHPWHQGVLYQVGLAAALTGRKMEAIENLRKAILIDNSFRVEGLSDFNSIKDTPEFKHLVSLQKEWAAPVIHSDTAFTLKDRSLHAEGLAVDPETGAFYVGSIHERKIVRVRDGVATDFCKPETDGMTSIFGLKIDAKRKWLWACSSPMAEMQDFDSSARSAVYKFDLVTGNLLEKIQRPSWEKDGVFGDLALDKNGNVYISDSQTNTIFILNAKTHKLEPWFTSPEFWNIQGLVFWENDRCLFISDYIKGLFKLTLPAKTLTSIACPLEVSLKGIDGICYYKNSILAIQNGVNPLRATRYFLSDDLIQITSFSIIDRKHPAFNEPTLGAINGDVFYYIANSQWSGYDQRHHIKPADQLQDIVILQYNLKKQ